MHGKTTVYAGCKWRHGIGHCECAVVRHVPIDGAIATKHRAIGNDNSSLDRSISRTDIPYRKRADIYGGATGPGIHTIENKRTHPTLPDAATATDQAGILAIDILREYQPSIVCHRTGQALHICLQCACRVDQRRAGIA
ncbi:hypothetical protein GCM10007901_15470 [Dyella acidisoli]|uniref:Uncharacterized protein n=1 Tax=Dyella acidisoli TaxID=1867834 RepID=A0ABQ5XN13_9GAMM|nr:hypothetical protein GCM10007901_15470 [Dyella acidisoli]